MSLILAVDGGGTKTLAAVVDRTGQVRGTGRAGNCDIYAGPAAFGEVARAVRDACAMAGVSPQDIENAVYSLCGADWPEDFTLWLDHLSREGLGRHIRVVNDALGAMHADLSRGNLLAVIVGTGCATGARNADGRMWHSSFWQLVQGGTEMSAAVLEALYRAELGITGPTALRAPVLAHFGMADVERLLHAFTARDIPRPARARQLAPILMDVAHAGDEVARGIVRRFGTAYGEMAVAAARQVGILGQDTVVMFAGGVFRHHSQLLREVVIDTIHPHLGEITVLRSRNEPLKGAIVMALQEAGVEVDDAVAARIDNSLPDMKFFHSC